MKILLLINWHIEYGQYANDSYLPSDYCLIPLCCNLLTALLP